MYLLAGVPRSWSQALYAGVVAGGPGAVASHSSAARLWGFAYWPDAGFEITVPRGRGLCLEGIRVPVHASRSVRCPVHLSGDNAAIRW